MRLPGRLLRGPVRPDRGSIARFASLRWAALPVIDRRWTAPMSAVALGFGLFVGVAIGPGTQGSLGTARPMVIQVPVPATPPTALAPPAAPDGRGGTPDRGLAGSGGGGAPPADSPPPAPPLDSLGPPVTTPPIYTPPVAPPPVTTTGDEPASEPTEPADEPATLLAGTVVHRNPEAVGYTIAAEDGSLTAIHSRKPPQVGESIEVEARRLANGTYAEEGKRKEDGARGRAEFTGTVSFRDPRAGVYTVSAPGVSLLVRGGTQRTPPEVGEQVEVEARIADNAEPLPASPAGADGCGKPPALPKPPRVTLEQVGMRVAEGGQATSTDVEAIVEGVCRDSRELIVSADDVRESGHDIVLAIPQQIRLAALKPGQVLKLSAEIGAARALTLSTVAGDEGSKGADAAGLVQP